AIPPIRPSSPFLSCTFPVIPMLVASTITMLVAHRREPIFFPASGGIAPTGALKIALRDYQKKREHRSPLGESAIPKRAPLKRDDRSTVNWNYFDSRVVDEPDTEDVTSVEKHFGLKGF